MTEQREHLQSAEAVLSGLSAAETGLTDSAVAELTDKYGANKLQEAPKKPLLLRIWEQIRDPMVLILAAAGIVSGYFKEYADMAIILIVIVLNTVLGIFQESKAEAAIEALQKMSAAMSKVRRNGQELIIPSAELVPGDIIRLEAGDSVPADVRLLETAVLKIEEAALTGESVPSDKSADVLKAPESGDVPLGDRHNMAYMGTSVVYGRATAVVVRTGMATEMGKIANALANTDEERTPLQKKLDNLSKVLSIAVLGICAFIFAYNVFITKDSVFDSFLTAISLAVAAIPEGLVVVVTVLLSIGVKNMSKKNAIIRRLSAVETLGCTQVICSDKTGTLTQNKMTVVENYGITAMLQGIMYNCNDAKLAAAGDIGDPTEIALKIFGKSDKTAELERIGEAPFDSVRKMMSTFHKVESGVVQFTKGAPDEVLARCTALLLENGKTAELTDELKRGIMSENKRMADKALRVLAGAMAQYGELPSDTTPDAIEKGLCFVGLAGMIDPIRPEVKLAVSECNDAGIRAVMITGDHQDTAVAIANELGILTPGALALTGSELAAIPEDEYDVTKYSVYARVQPEHKVRIVSAWKKRGAIAAMTGDGVNDAPAIKASDIGIGMGITGTDVTKNVADMVLADDNFATIVGAVKEGRRIYENIRKAVQFLLSSNLAEVVSIFIATVMGFALFKPIHILWINLVTDCFPAIALGFEHEEADSMSKPPRNPKASIFSDGLGIDVIWQGVVIAGLALVSYFLGASEDGRILDEHAAISMTMAFLTLSMCEVFHSLNMRSRIHSIFTLTRQNVWLWGAMVLSTILTFGVIYIPGLNDAFELFPLNAKDFFEALGLAFAVIPVTELVKLVRRIFEPKAGKLVV
ncbi:MAG: cation-translocating P-type ATPase [Oscillospiraceae bacterium]|jgi:Ca2+-transporting ATPase|nr:cation-translocating P-type ATPase [Oscillospiraceae bacterium]